MRPVVVVRRQESVNKELLARSCRSLSPLLPCTVECAAINNDTIARIDLITISFSEGEEEQS